MFSIEQQKHQREKPTVLKKQMQKQHKTFQLHTGEGRTVFSTDAQETAPTLGKKEKKSGFSSPPANGRDRFCRRVIAHL